MPNFDFLAQPSLPRPEATVEDAVRIAGTYFGLRGTVTELGSQQDRNFLVDTGSDRFVLKLANPVFSADELHAQNAALRTLAGTGVRIPQVVPALDGSDLVEAEVQGRTLLARTLHYLDGEPLTGVAEPDRGAAPHPRSSGRPCRRRARRAPAPRARTHHPVGCAHLR